MSKPAKPDAAVALELVREYARLQDQIDGARKRIGSALEPCPGISGHRLETEHAGELYGEDLGSVPTDRAMKDDVHLKAWYTPDDDGTGRTVYPEPSESECPHCWAAHQVVQERKRARRSLGAVKGCMRKLGRKAA